MCIGITMLSSGYTAFDGKGAYGDVWFEVDGYAPTEGVIEIDHGDGTVGMNCLHWHY